MIEEFEIEKIESALATKTMENRNVAACISQDGKDFYLSTDPTFTLETPVVVGCVMKCITSTLLAKCVHRLSLGFRDRVVDHLRVQSKAGRSVLEGLELWQLLNHTHGLDDADIDLDAVPRHPCGRIDIDALCTRIARAPRISTPGLIYSYGGVGSWLVAGILEQRFDSTYFELLKSELLGPLGIDIAADLGPHDVCPAWGGRLALSALDLMQFLRPHLSAPGGAIPEPLGLLRTGEVAMPAWGPWQCAATCGWNVYGLNWLGHNGNRDGTGVALRFHRTQSLAVAVTSSREMDCFFVMARLFGEMLEEFSVDYVGYPRPLGLDEWDARDRSRFLGFYDNARWRIGVTESSRPGFLRMRVFDRRSSSSDSILDRQLRAAERDVFLVVPPGADYPFAQFVGEDAATGHSSYFWNGRQLWRYGGG